MLVPGITGSLVVVFKCNTWWGVAWCIFWLRYEIQLDCLLLNLFLYNVFISSADKQVRVSLPLPFVLPLVHLFSSCRGGSLCSFAVQEGEFLEYLHLGSSWATSVCMWMKNDFKMFLFSWLCNETWSVQKWVCMYIGTHFTCFLLTLLFFS